MRAGVQVCLGIICAIQFLTIAHAAAAPSSQQVVVFLDFYRRWDTLDQDHAAEAARQILHGVHDFEAFALKAPRDSEARRLFLLHFASFEDAAQLVRTGEMNEQLLYEGWYALPDSWIKAKPYIEGLRREMNQPELLEGLEWLAGRADRYWLEQKEHPTHWEPVDRPPTKGDRAIAVAFNRVWSTDRDKTAMKFFDELTSRAHTEQEFSVAAPPGSTAYTKLDRVLCAYDLAGELMKFGDLNPTLFFEQWGSAATIWEKSSAWVATIRKSSPSGGGYDSAEWLANYEQQWHAAHPSH